MNDSLQTLVERLKTCPTRDARVTKQTVSDTWERLKLIPWREDQPLFRWILASVILHDDTFRPLLNESEHELLHEILISANDRFVRLTCPNVTLGSNIRSAIEFI